jgi:hypothetical protein
VNLLSGALVAAAYLSVALLFIFRSRQLQELAIKLSPKSGFFRNPALGMFGTPEYHTIIRGFGFLLLIAPLFFALVLWLK